MESNHASSISKYRRGHIFSAENIRNCEKHVLSIQRRLDKAVADNDKDSIQGLVNILTRKSEAVRVLATWRITQRNQGKYTAGVDGIAIPKGDRNYQNQIRLQLKDQIDIGKRPDSIRRVYIPKPNGKKRPLGIPTLQDRIVQEVLRIAIEPIAEYHFSDNSFGFRPKRSCQDAVSMLQKFLAKSDRKNYVIEGDIKGCFDNINHKHIINTLKEWLIPNWTIQIIERILKSGIFDNGEIYDSDTGTPQGGVISPLLANIALTTLDDFCFQKYGRYNYLRGRKQKTNPIVRYADDFVIICKSEKAAKEIKSEIANHLLDTVGLTLSEEKTKITHITKGFDFLGFNFRKYKEYNSNKGKLLIKPEKEKVVNLLKSCKETLTDNKSAEQSSVIYLLNQKLIGWGMYYRQVCSKATFCEIDHQIWWKSLRWAKRRHPNKSKTWVINRYYSSHGNRATYFTDKETNSEIFRLAEIPIERFVKITSGFRVYDKNPETIEYWNKRDYKNAYEQIYSVKMRKLYKRQKGTCPYCNGQLTQRQILKTGLHVHHMKPRSLGGNEGYGNLRLLHDECHRELHAKFSRKEMFELSDTKVDYTKPNLSENKYLITKS